MNDWQQEIFRAAELIVASRFPIALTGAGISTASGIPDFRSPESGLWNTSDPAVVASIESFRVDPQPFYTWNRALAARIATARPNAAHRALAQLEKLGRVRAIITQNVDDLHQRAGSRKVVELHGNMKQSTCLSCRREIASALIQDHLLRGSIPHCPCGGVYKPNVVFFGEMLPLEALGKALSAAEACDLMIVAGSSLEVVPAAEMPWTARDRGASLIVLNLQETPIDDEAEVAIHEDLVKVLPRIAREVKSRLGL